MWIIHDNYNNHNIIQDSHRNVLLILAFLLYLMFLWRKNFVHTAPNLSLISYKLYYCATAKTTEYNEISILKNVLKLHYIAFHEIYTILQTFYLFFYDMHNIQCIVTHTLTLTVIIRVHKYLARKNHAYIKNLSTKSSHLFTIMSYCIYINSY